jgi:hypothetical protein
MTAEPSLSALLLTIALAASPKPAASPSPSAPAARPSADGKAVIIFLIDNSASLPPLDPEEKRVTALEKLFTFLKGNPYRLILFAGRKELFVDDPSKYRNTGQWTDYYFAFEQAIQVMREYPEGTEFRIVLVTDAIIDPSPDDWTDMDVPPGADLRAYAAQRTLQLLQQMGQPLYIILVGDAPAGPAANAERAPGFILDMSQAANGRLATPFAQSVADFFADDGLLLKKFVFRIEPGEGLKEIQPVVARIAAPSSPVVETGLAAGLVLPLALFLFLLVGILVRSFPGRGDVEVLELPIGQPVHVAADRLHKLQEGGWSGAGLSLVADPREAAATFALRPPDLDLTGAGVDTSEADAETRALLPLPLEELRHTLERYEEGTKEQKIFALNLDYMAKNLAAAEVERAITTPPAQRGHIPAIGFLRAKAHLLSNDALRHKLLDPRVHVQSFGPRGERKEVHRGGTVNVGAYTFLVQDVAKGGRKDVKVILHYERIPSLWGIKNWVPARIQRLARFRRGSLRVVG